MSSLRPEWPGDGARRAPEPPRDQWSGDRFRGAPEPQRDQWAGHEAQHHQRGVPRTNPVAIASLLCGIALILDLLGSLGSILVAVPAFVCGGIALWQINTRRERGQGIAIAGLGLGLIGNLFVVVVQG